MRTALSAGYQGVSRSSRGIPSARFAAAKKIIKMIDIIRPQQTISAADVAVDSTGNVAEIA